MFLVGCGLRHPAEFVEIAPPGGSVRPTGPSMLHSYLRVTCLAARKIREPRILHFKQHPSVILHSAESESACKNVGRSGWKGTIDKDYPRSVGGYAFEIGSSAAQSILDRMNLAMPVEYGSVFRKDSQEINDWDRELLSQVCQASTQSRILITHGTDSMIDTAAYLAKKRLPKTIILTGAFRPEKFKDSDADFNVGVAIGALQTIHINDVFIAMNGRVYWWNEVTRNQETGQFICKLK